MVGAGRGDTAVTQWVLHQLGGSQWKLMMASFKVCGLNLIPSMIAVHSHHLFGQLREISPAVILRSITAQFQATHPKPLLGLRVCGFSGGSVLHELFRSLRWKQLEPINRGRVLLPPAKRNGSLPRFYDGDHFVLPRR